MTFRSERAAPARWVLIALAFLLGLAVFPAAAQSVAFINPGRSGEAFWVTVSRSMEAAARSLGMQLEVLYAEREFPRALALAQQIAQRPASEMPDYVIVANEAGAGPELVRVLAPRTKVFVAFSGIPAGAESAVGQPRQLYPNWIGSLEPRAEEAGYLTARALIEKARAQGLRGPDGRVHLLALSGDRSTTTSVLRSAGMRRAVAEAGDAVIDQEVYAAFSRERAREMADVLFSRHPQARVVWAGSDQMAFGAMQALEQRGRVPGRDVLFGGINTSAEAIEGVRSGRLAALAGGHFILGAWALVMIHDHHRGVDFAASEGTVLEPSMFILFTPREAGLFQARYGADSFDAVDFRRFSKVRTPALKRYDFSFGQWLR